MAMACPAAKMEVGIRKMMLGSPVVQQQSSKNSRGTCFLSSKDVCGLLLSDIFGNSDMGMIRLVLLCVPFTCQLHRQDPLSIRELLPR